MGGQTLDLVKMVASDKQSSLFKQKNSFITLIQIIQIVSIAQTNSEPDTVRFDISFSCLSSKACLHYGKNYTKFVRFKNAEYFFLFFKTH